MGQNDQTWHVQGAIDVLCLYIIKYIYIDTYKIDDRWYIKWTLPV